MPSVANPILSYPALKTAIIATPISIKKDVVQGYSIVPVQYKDHFSKPDAYNKAWDTHEGTAMMKFDGNYDADTGMLSGTTEFDIDLSIISHDEYIFNHALKIVDLPGQDWKEKGSGKFTGQIVGDRALLKFKVVNTDGLPIYYAAAYQMGKFPEEISAETPKELVEQKDSGARFSGMTGQVEWRADDDPDGWKLCKMGDKLPIFAHIRTLEDSSAILSFSDMSTYVLKEGSEVVIDTPPEKESKIKLVAGNIWVNVKKMITDGSMEIEMNQAVAGIKGTTFIASETDGVSKIKVVEGTISFKSKAGGEALDIKGGESAATQNDGTILKTNFNLDEEEKSWDNVIKADFAQMSIVPDPDAPAKSVSKSTASAAPQSPLLIGGGIVLMIILGAIVFRKMKK